MAPFSMRCNSCGEYIYKGKKVRRPSCVLRRLPADSSCPFFKFNARKETVENEDYYGIRVSRGTRSSPRACADVPLPLDPDLPLLHQVHAVLL